MISDSNINLLINILSNSANAEEKQRFDAWLNEAEGNRLYFEEVRILWERSKETYNNMEFDEAAAKEKIRSEIQQIHPKARVFRKRFVISAAASIIILLGLGIAALYLSKSGDSKYIEYTSTNQIREIILPDSSHIWLNENSSLRAPIEFSAAQRKVILEGEAYFEITRNESRPFKVRAGNTMIKVLGTTFDVKTDIENGNVCVMVNSGKVAFYRVNRLHENYILTQGTTGQFIASDQKIIVSGNENQNYLSWKTGSLSFYDTSLREVCAVLSDYYKTTIYTNLSDSNLFLTGNFQNETLDDILKTIELTLDLEASVSEEGILIHD